MLERLLKPSKHNNYTIKAVVCNRNMSYITTLNYLGAGHVVAFDESPIIAK